VHVGVDERIQERESCSVIHHLVFVGDDPEHVAGVVADVGLEPLGRDQLRWMLGAEVIGPLRALHDEHVTVRDLPAQSGLLERLVDRLRVLVEHDAQSMPRHFPD
jgi:hypothetical protein